MNVSGRLARDSEPTTCEVPRSGTAAGRTASRCLVCGFSEVRTDEVIDGGVMFLGWCPRCDHRWTSRVPSLRATAVASPPEVRSEAA